MQLEGDPYHLPHHHHQVEDDDRERIQLKLMERKLDEPSIYAKSYLLWEWKKSYLVDDARQDRYKKGVITLQKGECMPWYLVLTH